MISSSTRYVARFAALVIAAEIFLLASYVISRQIEPDPIVYYAGLRCVGYSVVVFILLLLLLRTALPAMLSWLRVDLLMPIAVIYVLSGYSFVITIPSLLDRSISIYLIAAVAQAEGRGLAKNDLQAGFLRDYVEGTTTVDKRLNEQLVSNNIAERGERYFITDRGRFVYDVNRRLARLFRIPPKYTEPPLLGAPGP